jgi:broad specificity phosphatase PhoE
MKPKRIFLVRHGEAEGNVDKDIYKVKPDFATLLTPKGVKQAQEVGDKIKHLIQGETLAVYYSPYFRTRMTTHNILSRLEKHQFSKSFLREDVTLREQEWTGSFRTWTGTSEQLKRMEDTRTKYGHALFRLSDDDSTGESCADVYDRLSDFNHTLHRDFEKRNFPNNVLLVTHGMTMRVFLWRWFHLTLEEFEILANPKNCELWKMVFDSATGKYELMCEPRKYDRLRCEFPYPFDAVGVYPK